MDIQSIKEDIARVQRDLDHASRSRQDFERVSLHLRNDERKVQKKLKEALDHAQHAQLAVHEAQQELTEITKRNKVNEESLQMVAEKESMLAIQLRDLTNESARFAQEQSKQQKESEHSSRSFYR